MSAKLKLPPGISNNGTDYSGAGQWIDCNLMRWEQGVLKTIGGWQLHAVSGTSVVGKLDFDPAAEAARSGIAISGLSAGVFTFLGTNKEIYLVDNANVVSIVTPAEFVQQPKDTVVTGGYGTWLFGAGAFGTPRPAPQSEPTPVFSWGFAPWGEDAIACARGVTDQKLYIREPTGTLFVEIPNSPVGATDVIVTDERIVMTVGASGADRTVTWSDREDYDSWTPSIANMAGSYTISGAGRLVAIKKVQNQILVLGENDVFRGQFLGPPYIYGFSRVGDKCGVVSATAVAATSDFAMWFGMDTFWLFDGTLRNVPCSVLNYMLQDMDNAQKSKVCAFTNSAFDEVWWLYQSSGATDCDSYVAYNYKSQIWYIGKIDRTVGLDDAALKYLMMVSTTGGIFDHEIPNAGYSGAAPYISSGPLEIENGSRLFGMSYLYPDNTEGGGVKMQVEVRDFPKNPPLQTLQFDLLSPTSTTGVLGRDLRLKFYSSLINEMWMLGDMRVEPIAAPTGRR